MGSHTRDDCYVGRTHHLLQDNLKLTVHSMFTVPNVFGAWHRAPPLSWIMSHNLDASHISMTLQYIGVHFRRFIHVLQQSNPPSNWFQLVMPEVVGPPCPHKGQFLYHSFSMSLRGCWPHVVPIAWWWGCPTLQMRSCGVPPWHKWSQSRSYDTCRATTYFWSEHPSPKFVIPALQSTP